MTRRAMNAGRIIIVTLTHLPQAILMQIRECIGTIAETNTKIKTKTKITTNK